MSQSNLALPVHLWSGASISYLPQTVLNPIISGLGSINSDEFGGLIVPCSQARSSATLNFGFGGDGGPSISIPLAELLLPVINDNGSRPTFSNGESICYLGIAPRDPGPYVLGDTFFAQHTSYLILPTTRSQSPGQTTTQPLRMSPRVQTPQFWVVHLQPQALQSH